MAKSMCRVCGAALENHVITIQKGIPHAGRLTDDGKVRSCSQELYRQGYGAGCVATLRTIIRSLRWHAGRLQTLGDTWRPWQLRAYADKLMADVTALEAQE